MYILLSGCFQAILAFYIYFFTLISQKKRSGCRFGNSCKIAIFTREL